MSKYKAPLFLLICAALFALGIFCLFSYFPTTYLEDREKQQEAKPITHTHSKTTIWKNGSFASTTTIEEAFAITKNLEEIEHASKGWAVVRWKKERKKSE